MLKRILFLLVVSLVSGSLLYAQVTTAVLTGDVKSNTREALVGATVIATHLPSGTKYSTVSRTGGQYNIQNMRVGGPYLIEVSFVGHKAEKYENIFLQLGEPFLLNAELTSATAAMENVVVSSRRNSILNAGRTGAVTNVGTRQINQLPSISRSLNDITRVTPQANGASVGGGNYRQNNFTVDGSDFNNSFGIGSNLPAGGAPISLDAIDEISVNITPFDIRQSGFIGSAINAVTRAGTNTFSGSVYNYFRTEKQRGDQVEASKFIRPTEEFKQYGFRLGGPIVKNKLFFFMNYETENQPKSIQNFFAATAAAPYGSAANIVRPTADSLNFISQFLLDRYGYVTGPYQGYVPNVERKKYLVRLDWNINNKHRMNVRYSQVEGGEPFTPSTSVSGSNVNYTSNRTASTALWFKNSNYFQGANLYSLAAELNSTFGKVSNTLRATYTFQNDSRSTDSQIFPFVDILSNTGGVTGPAPYTSFGYEPFSFGNLRQVKTYSVINNTTWTKGIHNWTVGGQFELSETVNGFQRFATSYYVFNTWADFANGRNPRDFAITYSLSKNFAPAFSAFKFGQYSLYGQDEIAVNKDLRVTVGLRVDLPTYPEVPQIITHPLVAKMSFAGGETINTGNLPKNRLMWSPRVGFNWDIYGDRSLQIRGGTGIFTGRVPFVWIVSQSGDNGMIQVTQFWNGQSNTPGPFNPNPAAYRPSVVPTAGTIVPGSITALVEDFRNPQTWKTTLAIDTRLGKGIVGTLEGIFNKDVNTAIFRNPNMIAPAALNIAGYPDNRPMYGTTNQTRFINTLNNGIPQAGASGAFNTVVLDNGNRGYYFSLTAKVEKTYSKGFAWSVAYTKSMASNLFDGGGDQPLSAWQGTANVFGPNAPMLSYADYVIPDRVVATLSYRKEYFKNLATTISAFYNGGINGRFSYVYDGDFNRDGVQGNDLMYIPTATEVQQMQFGANTVNGVSYGQNDQRALFERYIQQDKYLRAHRGQFAERNGAQLPWLNRLDVKILQDLFANIKGTKNVLQFSIDIFNAGNLIDPGWGKLKTINNSRVLAITNANNLIPGGTVLPIYRLASANGDIITKTFRDNVSIASTYSIQFGLRYIFN
ncbi:MAG: TonB-dependent receptor domain-containing protein [Bacteroidota bacterium]|jgi:hypothetical protein